MLQISPISNLINSIDSVKSKFFFCALKRKNKRYMKIFNLSINVIANLLVLFSFYHVKIYKMIQIK